VNKLWYWAAAAIGMTTASAGSATTVCVSDTLPASVDTAWTRIRDFGSHAEWIDGHPEVKLEGGLGTTVGVRRSTISRNGLRFDEVLTALDDRNRIMTYDVLGKLPIPAYDVHGSIQLMPITASGTTFAQRCLTYDTTLSGADAETFKHSREGLLAESLRLLAGLFKQG
jgi:hypothetical protein